MGASLQRATQYGTDSATYLKSPRNGALLFAMIESSLGVKNATSILAVDGVDGVVIGPGDLSADLGCLNDFQQPVFLQAVARVERAAADCGKILSTAPYGELPFEQFVERNYRLLIVGSDISLVREAMLSQVRNARAYCERLTPTKSTSKNEQIGSVKRLP